MGTVGLSFGSPTSGQGFDVSTTVSSIVANLQNVETPWKTQLTSLASQDTAISSLGTLFSNLSNDLSSLTDPVGIMAQKEGSVSDQNVLSLTAANNSAFAGTHTVEVGALAQTSSGYLAPISSASATLSGSITLQVGSSGASETITLNSSNNTLAGLAKAINASGAGVVASVLTDANGSRLSLISGTSGENGNIQISANTIAAANTGLNYAGTSGTSSTYSGGTLSPITNAGDALTGSLSVQVGTGTAVNVVIGAVPDGGAAANTIYTGAGNNTLADIASTITADTGLGFAASVVTNSDGSSSLSLTSNTKGTAGNLSVTSKLADTSNSLGYSTTVTGSNASLTVDGVNLTSASNTVANLIPGVTFQLLAPSATGEQVQVVIGNDNTGVESTVNQMVSDYNSLISAINTQTGNDSSGNPEPLFGSPTLTLLQQQLLGGLNSQNPNGTMTAISSSTGTTLAGSMAISVAGGMAENIVIGAAPANPVANTFYTGTSVTTLAQLAATINAGTNGTPLAYSGTAGSAGVTSSGTLTTAGTNAELSGSMTVAVGSGTVETVVIGAEPSTGAAANTIYTGTSVTTLAGLAGAINAATGLGFTANATAGTDGTTTLTLTSGTTDTAGTLAVTSSVAAVGTGVTASVNTANGESTLALASRTAGAAGVVTVSSSVTATTVPALTYNDLGTASTYSAGNVGEVAKSGDTLSGTLSVQVGNGATENIVIGAAPSGGAAANTLYTGTGNTLADVVSTIQGATGLDFSASVVTNSDGSSSLQLVSLTGGTAGALTVSSSLQDVTATTTTSMDYSNSSDINSLTSLGISVNNDGSLTFDASSLDSVLNTDYSGVMGFFQYPESWGQNFNTMLTNSGTTAGTGVLALASTSNSNIESTLNADISKENLSISSQQASLTAELNSANEIMQQLPSQLSGVNELYSAITGYNQNTNG